MREEGATRKVRAVLFDLDGTLLHSAPDLVASLNSVRAANGMAGLAVGDMEHFASAGAVGLLKAGMPVADEATLERWRIQFLEHYARNSCVGSTLYQGVPELIAGLLEAGVAWGLVTNKPAYLTGPILEHFGLSGSVGTVVCGDTIEFRKPHPAPVLRACAELSSQPGETIFVGDDLRDIEAGRAAGTVTCAALYGYGSPQFHQPENASIIDGAMTITAPLELLKWMNAART